VWPRDQLITFWWWSTSLSGSRSPFRIMIRIQQELTLSTHTEQMPCKNHSALLLCWHSAEICALWALLVYHVTKLNERVISHMIVPSSDALQKTLGWLGEVASRFTRPAWQPNTCSTSCDVMSCTRILQSAAELARMLSPDCGKNCSTSHILCDVKRGQDSQLITYHYQISTIW